MHEAINALIIAAMVVLVIVRRFTPRRVGDQKLLVFPVVLAVLALGQGGLVDPRHETVSVGLLVAEMVLALLLGLGLGATMQIWRKPDGSLWSKGTWATLGVFLLSVATRGGLVGLGAAYGVKPGGGTIMVSVAAWVLTQNAMLAWRARALPDTVTVYP